MSKTTTSKKIDETEIEAAAGKAGMTVSELLEWGLYCILETYDGTNGHPSDAKGGLEQVRKLVGVVPEEIIPSNPLAEFAADTGLHFGELNEFALLSVINIINESEFPDAQPKDILEGFRKTNGGLIPEFKEKKTAVQPFMNRLFSGDLKAVHGPTFGDPCSDHVDGEHQFLEENLSSAFALKTWDEACCQLMVIESVICHCPKLQNEAAAIRALIEAEKVLGNFCRAVNAA